MKAEHRKELETNVLADRMGRVVQGMKQAPQKRTLLYILLAGAVVAAIFIFVRKGDVQLRDNSERWEQFEDGNGIYLKELAKDPQSHQGKAAQFEIYYADLRQSLRLLATSPKQALGNLDIIEEKYREMIKLCKDDKILLPEAMFALAVIEETRIMKDKNDDHWKVAAAAFRELADAHPDSAYGKLAAKRVEVLNNEEKRNNLLNIYRDLRIQFMPEDRLPGLPPGFPPDHPPLLPSMPGLPK